MNSKLTYKGPVALYISYFVLLALSISLSALSFRVERESDLFVQLLATGIAAAIVSFAMILSSTLIVRRINPVTWRMKADSHYQDEGIFEYTHDGFSVITKGGKSLHVPWNSIERAESGESQLNQYIKKFHIDVYLSDTEFITVDSTMPGFHLYEKRLKHNLRGMINKLPVAEKSLETLEQKKVIS